MHEGLLTGACCAVVAAAEASLRCSLARASISCSCVRALLALRMPQHHAQSQADTCRYVSPHAALQELFATLRNGSIMSKLCFVRAGKWRMLANGALKEEHTL